MAEVIGLAASIIAIVQVADRVIGLCRFYLETVHDAPSDLRAILVETSAIKAILENVGFLVSCNNQKSTILEGLSGQNGPVEGCRTAIAKMEELIPSAYFQASGSSRSKRQKVNASLAYLAWPLKTEKAKKLLEELGRLKLTIHLALTSDSIHDIKDIKSQTKSIHAILTDDQRDKVYKWLQVTDPTSLHHRACKQYEPGTGNWMLRSAEWKSWLDAKTRCVWIHGIPGAGKTVLVSHLIGNIKEHCEGTTTNKCAYVYYYCYFGNNQDESAPFLRWIINKFCRQAKLVPTCLNNLYEQGGEPSLTELLSALEAILEVYDNVYIVIDAVDESMPRDDLLRVLRDLLTDSRFKKLQLLASSRQYIDIEKVMEPISVPVSMTNPLLDEDIKLYVRLRLSTNHKFKDWPQRLLDEVLEVLSTKAKGMFRWAVCQIHALERLKPEDRIVKDALVNLPKTLDETYERIFLEIPDEDRIIVHYVLKWIYYHQEMRDENISCQILLQAIERSLAESGASRHNYSFDEELLRELCGCLITILPGADDNDISNDCKIRTASFAHYTVWEFLDSPRIFNTPAAFFGVVKESIKMELTKTSIRGATKAHYQYDHGCLNESEPNIDIDEDFKTYCIAMSISALGKLGDELSKDEESRELAFNLLNASNTHFPYFKKVVILLIDESQDFDVEYLENIAAGITLKKIWRNLSRGTDAALLTSLLLVDETFELAEIFTRQINIQETLQTQLVIDSIEVKSHGFRGFPISSDHKFRGSIIELFAQMYGNFPEQFHFLLELGINGLDLSIALLGLAGTHYHDDCSQNNDYYCAISRLLQLGAKVNDSRHVITPLQIATSLHDVGGVKVLLEAGADPNGIGNSGGIQWESGTFLDSLIGDDLDGGLRPLEICRNIRRHFTQERDGAISKIETMLIQYGGEPLSENGNDEYIMEEDI